MKKTPLKPGTKPLSRSTPIQRKPIQRKAVMPSAPNNAKTGLSVTGAVKSRPKKPKKPTRIQLRKKCDVLHGKIIRSLGYCQRCGKTQNLQRAHIFSRGYRTIEFDDRNTLCLDVGCHHWGHMHPIEWEAFCRQTIGDAAYEDLRRLALTHQPPDYEILLPELQKRWSEISETLL